MSKATRLGAATLVAVLASTSAFAADRAYLMRGLGGALISRAVDTIGSRVSRAGAVVTVGDHYQWNQFATDAAKHRVDRIVCVGHSRGGDMCIPFAAALRRLGVKNVRVVTIDPTHLVGRAPPGVAVTNFYRPGMAIGGGSVQGARNIPMTGYGHIQLANDPRVQARVVSAAIGK